mgnify:CR=1 FL=1
MIRIPTWLKLCLLAYAAWVIADIVMLTIRTLR